MSCDKEEAELLKPSFAFAFSPKREMVKTFPRKVEGTRKVLPRRPGGGGGDRLLVKFGSSVRKAVVKPSVGRQ